MTELLVCVFVSGYDTLSSVTQRPQEQFIEESKYEAVGMREMIKGATDWDWEGVEGEKERDFGWRTAYQQENETGNSSNEEEGNRVGKRPEVYTTPDRKSRMLVLEFEGSKEWARGMGIRKEGVRRFLEILGCILSGDLGPYVR
ncbi:hypothetical protein B0T13DRAFT_497150 [Neurospora crassa]|nr:hypothetical protein B0T13DRAFT_497150 [Neurospora crassa]